MNSFLATGICPCWDYCAHLWLFCYLLIYYPQGPIRQGIPWWALWHQEKVKNKELQNKSSPAKSSKRRVLRIRSCLKTSFWLTKQAENLESSWTSAIICVGASICTWFGLISMSCCFKKSSTLDALFVSLLQIAGLSCQQSAFSFMLTGPARTWETQAWFLDPVGLFYMDVTHDNPRSTVSRGCGILALIGLSLTRSSCRTSEHFRYKFYYSEGSPRAGPCWDRFFPCGCGNTRWAFG